MASSTAPLNPNEESKKPQISSEGPVSPHSTSSEDTEISDDDTISEDVSDDDGADYLDEDDTLDNLWGFFYPLPLETDDSVAQATDSAVPETFSDEDDITEHLRQFFLGQAPPPEVVYVANPHNLPRAGPRRPSMKPALQDKMPKLANDFRLGLKFKQPGKPVKFRHCEYLRAASCVPAVSSLNRRRTKPLPKRREKTLSRDYGNRLPTEVKLKKKGQLCFNFNAMSVDPIPNGGKPVVVDPFTNRLIAVPVSRITGRPMEPRSAQSSGSASTPYYFPEFHQQTETSGTCEKKYDFGIFAQGTHPKLDGHLLGPNKATLQDVPVAPARAEIPREIPRVPRVIPRNADGSRRIAPLRKRRVATHNESNNADSGTAWDSCEETGD